MLWTEIFAFHYFQGVPGFRGPAGANGAPGEKVENLVSIFKNKSTTSRYILLYISPLIKT